MDAADFHESITKAKEQLPNSASVTAHSPEAYTNMKLFLTDDGTTGFALDGDDIVSVFNASWVAEEVEVVRYIGVPCHRPAICHLPCADDETSRFRISQDTFSTVSADRQEHDGRVNSPLVDRSVHSLATFDRGVHWIRRRQRAGPYLLTVTLNETDPLPPAGTWISVHTTLFVTESYTPPFAAL